MRRPLLFLLACLASTGRAAPFALELRGGPDVLSGAESFRLSYLGDNDSLPPLIAPDGLPFDRWYSASTKLMARWAISPETLRLPASSRVMLSAGLGQNIYTPRTARVASVEELGGDRPYSGWLAASLGLDLVLDAAPLSLTGAGYSRLGVELFTGGTGPWSLAGWTQYHAHNLHLIVSGQPLPPEVGWGVVETAPGLSFDASAFAETTLASVALAPPDWLSWSGGRPSWAWSVGLRADAGSTLVAAAAYTTLTAGWTGDALGHGAGWLPVAAYAFLRGEVRRVARNATIDGELLDGRVAARHEPWTGEIALGAVLRVWRAEASVGPVYRTNEVATLPSELKMGQLIWQGSVSYVF